MLRQTMPSGYFYLSLIDNDVYTRHREHLLSNPNVMEGKSVLIAAKGELVLTDFVPCSFYWQCHAFDEGRLMLYTAGGRKGQSFHKLRNTANNPYFTICYHMT